jgi:hypothetical protein
VSFGGLRPPPFFTSLRTKARHSLPDGALPEVSPLRRPCAQHCFLYIFLDFLILPHTLH